MVAESYHEEIGHAGLAVNRIRIPYNCVELIFGMVHPSTFERLKTQLVFSILGQTFRPWGSSSVTDSSTLKSRRMYHPKDRFSSCYVISGGEECMAIYIAE